MKKVAIILLITLMIMSLGACGNSIVENQMAIVSKAVDELVDSEDEWMEMSFLDDEGEILPIADYQEELDEFMVGEYERVFETGDAHKVVMFILALEDSHFESEEIRKRLMEYCKTNIEAKVLVDTYIDKLYNWNFDGYYDEEIVLNSDDGLLYEEQYCQAATLVSNGKGYYDDPSKRQENHREYGNFASYIDYSYYYYGDFLEVNENGFKNTSWSGETNPYSDTTIFFRGEKTQLNNIPVKASYNDDVLVLYKTKKYPSTIYPLR